MAAETKPPAKPLGYREVTSALEYCAWTFVVLAPMLRMANGPPVTPDQHYSRIISVFVALFTAVVLRLYHWRVSSRSATVADEASVLEDDPAAASRRRLEEAIREQPDVASNYLRLARLLISQGRLATAERTLQVAVDHCTEKHAVERRLRRVQQQRARLADEQQRRDARQRPASSTRGRLGRIPWAEALLGVAAAALLWRLFPEAWTALESYLGGPIATSVFLANVAVLAMLVWFRLR